MNVSGFINIPVFVRSLINLACLNCTINDQINMDYPLQLNILQEIEQYALYPAIASRC